MSFEIEINEDESSCKFD